MKKVILILIIFTISVIAQNQSNALFGLNSKQSKNNEQVALQVKNNVVNKINNSITPNTFVLEQNYPNPFNPTTKIQFSIPKETNVNLSVFNMLGQLVTTIYNGKLEAGTNYVEFDGSQLPSGIYFYRLEADNFVKTKKMTLMK